MTRREFVAQLMDKYPNVTGVSFGLKSIGGRVTREESIKFTVAEKKDLRDIPKEERIPSALIFDGVAFSTDVEVAIHLPTNNTLYPPGARTRGTIELTAVGNTPAGATSFVATGVTAAHRAFIENAITMGWTLDATRNGVSAFIENTVSDPTTYITRVSAISFDTPSTGQTTFTTSTASGELSNGETFDLRITGDTGDISGTHRFAPGIGMSGDVNEQTGNIVGGAGMGNVTSNPGSIGTLGFIAQDKATGAVVGVTNAHVAAGIAIGTMILEPTGYSDTDALPVSATGDDFQWPQTSSSASQALINANKKGTLWRVNQNHNIQTGDPIENTVDGTVLYLDQGTFDANSFKQFNSDVITSNPEWCTTTELDELIPNGNDLFSVGSRTGIKGSDIDYANGIRLKAVGTGAINLGMPDGINAADSIRMNDIIQFSAFDSTDADFDFGDGDYGTPVPGASQGGDSGSAVFANIGGAWKLAGLLFAGAYPTSGSFCRIDNVSEVLGVERWDGKTTQPIAGTKESIIIGGQQTYPSIVVNGRTYYRDGYTTDPANEHDPNI